MQVIIDWILAHAVVLTILAVALLDFIFALVPSWESNGIVHFIYLWLKGRLPAAK